MGSSRGREGGGPGCFNAPFRLCTGCTLAFPMTALSTHTGRDLRGKGGGRRRKGRRRKGKKWRR